MYTAELYKRCCLTVLIACLVFLSVMWGQQTVSDSFLRCSNLHIQLASEGFADVRAEADQADSGAAVRLFSASRTLVGVAECKQVGYAAAWIINIDIDDDDDNGTVDHQRFKCAPFTIPRARVTFIDGGREATVTCCQETRLTVASSFVPSQSIIVMCLRGGVWDVAIGLIECKLEDLPVLERSTNRITDPSIGSKPSLDETVALFNKIQMIDPQYPESTKLLTRLALQLTSKTVHNNIQLSTGFRDAITHATIVPPDSRPNETFRLGQPHFAVLIPNSVLNYVGNSPKMFLATLFKVNTPPQPEILAIAASSVSPGSANSVFREYEDAVHGLERITPRMVVAMMDVGNTDDPSRLDLRGLDPCAPLISLFFPYSDSGIWPRISGPGAPDPVCRSMDGLTGYLRPNLLFVNATAEGVWCASANLRARTLYYDVAWNERIPPSSVVEVEDLRWPLSANVFACHSTGPSIVVVLLFLAIILLGPRFLRNSRRMRDEHRTGQLTGIWLAYGGSKLCRDNDYILVILKDMRNKNQFKSIFNFHWANEHSLFGLCSRTRPFTRFSARARITTLFLFIITVVVATAFCLTRWEWPWWQVVICGMLAGEVVSGTVAFLFRNSRTFSQHLLVQTYLQREGEPDYPAEFDQRSSLPQSVKSQSKSKRRELIGYLDMLGEGELSIEYQEELPPLPDSDEAIVFEELDDLSSFSQQRCSPCFYRLFYEKLLGVDFNEGISDPEKLIHSFSSGVRIFAYMLTGFLVVSLVLAALSLSINIDRDSVGLSYYSEMECTTQDSYTESYWWDSPYSMWVATFLLSILSGLFIFEPIVFALYTTIVIRMFQGEQVLTDGIFIRAPGR
eukprot:531131_1